MFNGVCASPVCANPNTSSPNATVADISRRHQEIVPSDPMVFFISCLSHFGISERTRRRSTRHCGIPEREMSGMRMSNDDLPVAQKYSDNTHMATATYFLHSPANMARSERIFGGLELESERKYSC